MNRHKITAQHWLIALAILLTGVLFLLFVAIVANLTARPPVPISQPAPISELSQLNLPPPQEIMVPPTHPPTRLPQKQMQVQRVGGGGGTIYESSPFKLQEGDYLIRWAAQAWEEECEFSGTLRTVDPQIRMNEPLDRETLQPHQAITGELTLPGVPQGVYYFDMGHCHWQATVTPQ